MFDGGGEGVAGLNLRPRCRFFQNRADLHESLSDAESALGAMRA